MPIGILASASSLWLMTAHLPAAECTVHMQSQLAKLKEKEGKDHPEVASALFAMAQVFLRQDRAEEAQEK